MEKRGLDERPGRHEPILDEPSYRATVAAVRARTRVGKKSKPFRTYLLRGVIRCSCGSSMRGEARVQRGGERRYYRCPRAGREVEHADGPGRRVRCGARLVPADAAEHAVLNEIGTAALPPSVIHAARVELQRRLAAPEDGLIDRQRQRLDVRLGQLRKQHEWGDISDEEYRAARAETQAAIALLPDGDKLVLFWPPRNPEGWGWRAEAATTYGHARDSLRQQGYLIGWLSDEGLYLDPDPSFAAAQAMAISVGEPIGISPNTMYRRLKDAGFLLTAEAERERLTVRRMLQGARRAVLHIRSDLFEEPSQPAQPAQPADDADHGEDKQGGPRSHESASGKVVPQQPAQVGAVPDDEVLETVRAALASGLLGSRPVRVGNGEQATDPALAAAKWLGEAERPGWVGDVARVHLARLWQALQDRSADA